MSDTQRGSERQHSGRGFELIAVLATGAAKLVFGLRPLFIVAVALFWIGYVLVRYRRDRSLLRRWGLTLAGGRPALHMIAPFALFGCLVSVVYGLAFGTAHLNRNLALLLVLYVPWGTIQQFVLAALFADNLVTLSAEKLSEATAVVICAILFSAVHLPQLPLVIVTFLMGLVTTSVFFRTRNILVPGVFHGWFATAFYFFVMGYDPWQPLVQAVLGG
ncbi:MAG: CPBP family intramembrane metalloprotease [Spirochaetaceae bacterium]|nr:MAG: CPBP family intramembrane metalloprotease [Spirochaetaceae bacterium]